MGKSQIQVTKDYVWLQPARGFVHTKLVKYLAVYSLFIGFPNSMTCSHACGAKWKYLNVFILSYLITVH